MRHLVSFLFATGLCLACKATDKVSQGLDFAVGTSARQQCADLLARQDMQKSPVFAAYESLMTELRGGSVEGFPNVESIESFIGGTPGLGRTIAGAKVLDLLSQDPRLEVLLDAAAGVSEGYTIRQHTQMVFDVLNEQRRYYRLPEDMDSYRLLVYTIALHDIAKPVANELGDKRCQHEFTAPLVQLSLNAIGFNGVQSRLGAIIVGNDHLGNYAKGLSLKTETIERLRAEAVAAGVAVNAYLRLQKLLYICDANSYPYVRERFFSADAFGKLDHKTNSLEHVTQGIKDHDLDIVYSDGRLVKQPKPGPLKPVAKPAATSTAKPMSPIECEKARDRCHDECGNKYHWIFNRSIYLQCYESCDREFRCSG